MSEIWSKMYIGLHVKYRLLWSDLKKKSIFFPTDFRKKNSNIKFHENPSSGSRVVPCGQTDRHDDANSRFSQILRTRLKKKSPHKLCSVQRRMITKLLELLKSPWSFQTKYPWILSDKLTKNHAIYPVGCLGLKWQPAGQESHKRVAEADSGFLLLSVGRNHWHEVLWRHFLLYQGNDVATSYASRRGISRN